MLSFSIPIDSTMGAEVKNKYRKAFGDVDLGDVQCKKTYFSGIKSKNDPDVSLLTVFE